MVRPRDLKDKCAIVGIGETRYSRGGVPYTTGREKTIEASVKAVDDSGLTTKDIDGVIMTGAHYGGSPDDIISCFGIEDLTFHAIMNMGGAGAVTAIQSAILAIASGFCHNVLIPVGWNGYTEMKIGSGHMPISNSTFYDYRLQLELPHGHWTPRVVFGPWFTRYVYETGITSRELGAIAVACRKHACLNDNAVLRTPITIKDYENSPMVTNCLHLLDCSVEADGAGAVVITSAERARNLRHRPIYIMGVSEGHPPFVSDNTVGRPEFLSWGIAAAGNRALEMADVYIKDVSFAEIYDAFTFITLLQLEQIGFFKRGEFGAFVEGGRIELGGELPINTHGGLLSQAHILGINHLAEAVKQLRGQAGRAQVLDAEIGLVTGMGDVGDCGVVILRR